MSACEHCGKISSAGGWNNKARANATPGDERMTARTERHQRMAETYLAEHQAMTRAHIEGRTPVLPTAIQSGPIEFYNPQRGASITEMRRAFRR